VTSLQLTLIRNNTDYVVFGGREVLRRLFIMLRFVLGLAPRRRGRHAQSATPLWPEMLVHYVVALYTWSADELGDWSALSRGTRVTAAIATFLAPIVWIWAGI